MKRRSLGNIAKNKNKQCSLKGRIGEIGGWTRALQIMLIESYGRFEHCPTVGLNIGPFVQISMQVRILCQIIQYCA